MVSDNDSRKQGESKVEMTNLSKNIGIKPEMDFCPNCGIKNKNQNKFCSNCGTELTNSDSNNSLSNGWLLIGALFPIIGVIGGLYYAFKGKKGAGALIIISIIFWAIWAVVFALL